MSRIDDIRARLTELQKNYPKAESKLETRYRGDGTIVQTGASGGAEFQRAIANPAVGQGDR